MNDDRLKAEWLNLADATERAADQIDTAHNDPVSRSYVAKQLGRAALAALRGFWLTMGSVNGECWDELQEACFRVSRKLAERNPRRESTGERRGR